MKDNFAACLAAVLRYEGGFVNHPADPGGATMKGVTQAVYDRFRRTRGLTPQSVRLILDSELQAIYRLQYWDAVNGDTLDKGVDLAVFDPAVNSGSARAKQWLAASVGGSSIDTIKRVCAKRLSFVQGLKTWATFGKGWGRRIADVEALAIKMAAGAQAPAVLKQEAAKATQAKTNAKTGAKVSTAGTAGTAAGAHTSVSHDLWPYVIGAIVIAGILTVVICIYRAHVEGQRAAALGEASNG